MNNTFHTKNVTSYLYILISLSMNASNMGNEIVVNVVAR